MRSHATRTLITRAFGRWAGIGLFLAVSGIRPAFAGYITLESRLDIKVEGDQARAIVAIENKGQEAAERLQVTVVWPNQETALPVQDSLRAGQVYRAEAKLSLASLRAGRYPVIMRLLYTDANRYQLSTLTVGTLDHQATPRMNVWAVLGNVSFATSVKVRLHLKAVDAPALQISARLVSPVELSVENPVQKAVISTSGGRDLVFKVRNFSALPGSRLPLFALIEQDQAGVHDTVVAQSLALILPNTRGPDLLRAILIGIVLVLVVGTAVVQVKARRRNSR